MDVLRQQIRERIIAKLKKENKLLEEIYSEIAKDYAYLWAQLENIETIRRFTIEIVKLFLEEHSRLEDISSMSRLKFRKDLDELIKNPDALLQRFRNAQIREIENEGIDEWFVKFKARLSELNSIISVAESPENVINLYLNNTVFPQLSLTIKDEKRILRETNQKKHNFVRRSFTNLQAILRDLFMLECINGRVNTRKWGEEEERLESLGIYEKSPMELFGVTITPQELLMQIEQIFNEVQKTLFVSINIFPKNFVLALQEKKIRGLRDIQKDEGPYLKLREMVEIALNEGEFSGPIIYGAVAYEKEQWIGGSPGHGTIVIRLTSDKMFDATYTYGDSLTNHALPEYILIRVTNLNTVDSALARQVIPQHVALAKALLVLENQNSGRRFPLTETTYIEAQIRGGIDIKDVETVYIPTRALEYENPSIKSSIENYIKNSDWQNKVFIQKIP